MEYVTLAMYWLHVIYLIPVDLYNYIEPTAYLNFGQGTVPTLIEDSLVCTGTESGILLCPPSSNSTEGEICQTVTVRCHDSKYTSCFSSCFSYITLSLYTVIISSAPVTLSFGAAINKELGNGVYEFFKVWFGSVGITVSLAVRQGEVSMYAGDQSQSVSDTESNYDWTLTTSWYEDIFINPASVNRSVGNTLYITLKSNASFTNVTIDTSYGDTSTLGNCKLLRI